MTLYIVPAIFLGVLVLSLVRKKDAYAAFVKGAGAFLCGEHNNFSASGTDAPFRKLQKRRAQMRAAEAFLHGEPPDMPAVFFFEIAAGSPFT